MKTDWTDGAGRHTAGERKIRVETRLTEPQVDLFNLVAGGIGIVSFAFALWQHGLHREQRAKDEERRRKEEERLAAQARRAAAAVRLAVVGAQHADVAVQRAKRPDVTVGELQSLARLTRATLLTLATELEGDQQVMQSLASGQLMLASQDHTVQPPDAPKDHAAAGAGGGAGGAGGGDTGND